MTTLPAETVAMLDELFDLRVVGDQTFVNAHVRLRAELKTAAIALHTLIPPGPELALAMTKLEEATMWAKAGIARSLGTASRSDDGTLILNNEPAASDDASD